MVLPYLTMATQLNHMDKVYNLKVIEYDNGSVEIRSYEQPLNDDYTYHFIDENEERKARFDKLQKEVRKAHKEREERMFNLFHPEQLNPFTGEMVVVLDEDEFEHYEAKRQHSLYVSRNRTIQAIYKYSRQAVWEYFITLTFDPEKVQRYDFSECMKKTRIWLNHQKARYAPDLQYLFVPEQHEDGAWHIHGVIARVGNMQITDSGRVSINGKAYKRISGNQNHHTIYNLSGWKFGYSTATKVMDTHKVSTYITKYITKDLCESSKNRKRYYRSQNISEPKETEWLVEGDKEEVIQQIAESLGVNLEYEKSVESFISVDYKFYQ